MLYPRVFRYSDRMSIDKDAIIDLKISYDAKVIARSNGAEVGDMAIVVARNNNSDYCSLFICEIKKEVGETSLWKRKGGKKWKRGPKCGRIPQRSLRDSPENPPTKRTDVQVIF